MKSLVLYYSRTNKTKYVAEKIAQELKADIERITEKKDRTGMLGYLSAGRDAMTKKGSVVNPIKSRIDDYDTIIIGQPVWGFTMVPAIRTFCNKHNLKDKRIGLFCTMDGSGDVGCFKETRKFLLGSHIIGQATFVKPDKNRAKTIKEVKAFAARLHYIS